MGEGSKIFSLLNTLLLIEISLWTNDQLSDLIDCFDNFISADFDSNPDPGEGGNRLAQCSNPLMIIALTCELLERIASTKLQFRQSCDELKEGLLELGKEICDKIDEEDQFEILLNDVDFSNRTLLSIIVENSLEPLMSTDDPKSTNIINKIFIGGGSINCDGNIYGYSTFMHILSQSPGPTAPDNLYEMITMSYKVQNERIDYAFQHRYRRVSFKYIYNKDFYSQLLVISYCIFLPFYQLMNILIEAQKEITQNAKNMPKQIELLNNWCDDN